MKKKILIIGFFAFNTDYNGGQENKTRALADLLKKKYGEDNIFTIDTLGWKKRPIKLFYKTFNFVRKSDIVIMLPAKNGVKIFSKLLNLFKRKNTKLFYSVIGGWLPTITINNTRLKKDLLKFDGIWVETNSMKKDLNAQGFNNILIVPNFKKINPLSKENLIFNYSEPYKICTFSRVLREKGIEDAIEVVKRINTKYKKTIYELDIYGRIDANYKETFENMAKDFPDYISYKGVVPYNDTVKVLKDYFLLLFPTHYQTEGIPGTIIDAYGSGVPVLAAKWNSYDDVIVDGVTGIGFEQENNDELLKKLEEIVNEPEKIIDMKEKCLEEFEKYSEEYAFSIIDKQL